MDNAAATYYLLVAKENRENNGDSDSQTSAAKMQVDTSQKGAEETSNSISPAVRRQPPLKAGSKMKSRQQHIQVQGTLHRRNRTVGTPQEVNEEKEKQKGIRNNNKMAEKIPLQPPVIYEPQTQRSHLSPPADSETDSLQKTSPNESISNPRKSPTLEKPPPTLRPKILPSNQGKGHRRPHSHDAGDPQRGQNDPKPPPTVSVPYRVISPIPQHSDEMIIQVKPEEIEKVQQFLRTFDKPPGEDDSLQPGGVTTSSQTTTTKPRQVRILLNNSTVTHLPPQEVLKKIGSVLKEKNLNILYVSTYILYCKRPGLEFELEICALPNLDMHGIRFHRRAGDVWNYQEMCREILEELKLDQT